MIAYLVTLSPELSDQRRTQLDCHMPRSRITSRVLSLKSLSEDPAIRLLVQKGDMQGLYNDVKLTRFLEDHDVRSVLSHWMLIVCWALSRKFAGRPQRK